MNITARHLRALDRALVIVRCERYNRVGNPDPTVLQELDADVKLMEDAVRKLWARFYMANPVQCAGRLTV